MTTLTRLTPETTTPPPGGGSRAAAIFDLDHTLLPHATAERVFIAWFARRGHYGARTLWRTTRAVTRYMSVGMAGALREHRPYLRGWSVEEIGRLADEVVERLIAPHLSKTGLARIRWHQERGALVALLSGSTEFLVRRVAARVGIEHVLAAPLEVRDGRYTGELTGLHPYGIRKAQLAARFAADEQVDTATSYAYADHHTDRYLLDLVGHPVAVNPTRRLYALAVRRGWAVERWT